jgi:mono/diheme cytochrome c family protein
LAFDMSIYREGLGTSVALGVLLCTGLPGAFRHVEASEMQLPEGDGRFLILEACVQCHDLDPIVTQRKTMEGWRRSVNEMIWRGAPLIGNEAETVTNYLVATFGPDAPLVEPWKEKVGVEGNRGMSNEDVQHLPPGEGRALMLAACVQCHDLEPILTERRTAEGWRRSVAQMIQLGAKLIGDEAEVLTQYLTDSFGPDTPPIPDVTREPRVDGGAQ